MTRRHALVVHTRMPAFDRDAGSQAIDHAIGFLLGAGWDVSFLCKEEAAVAEERHAARLRQMGVATYAGFDWAERVLRSNSFDLALIAFWDLTADLLPMIRKHSPETRVVVDSIDVHFLRNARRSFGQEQELREAYGAETARELNTYYSADAVITVSQKEQVLLSDFLGSDRVFTVPLAESVERSEVPLEQRRGLLFVGNFRHLPNREAAEYLCREILPTLDPELLERHPLTVVGNWLENANLRIDSKAPGVNLVGWVPSVRPYLGRARSSVVPLLHGAGVKGKVIQSMMAYTPVVTTPLGAEGLDLVQGEHALIAADAADLAAGITRVLTDDDLWHRIAERGAEHVDGRHGIDFVRSCFMDRVERVMSRPSRAQEIRREQMRFAGVKGRELAEIVRQRLQMIAEPGAVVLVASGGDNALVELGSQPAWHFPEGKDGGWAGYAPVDGQAAVNHLEAQRARGARYFVLPRTAFTWRYRFPEFHDHLKERYRRVHSDEHLVVYDLADNDESRARFTATPAARVTVVGTYSADRTGPPPNLVSELAASDDLVVEQRWYSVSDAAASPATDSFDSDFVVWVRDDAILPSRFLDELIAAQTTLDADRVQPAHISGPSSGPPVAERLRGTVAREIDAPLPLPILSVRAGAAREGPVVLVDDVAVGLREPIRADGVDERAWNIRRVWVRGPEGRPVVYNRPETGSNPRISVLIATHNRPELLRNCISSFAQQSIDSADYEVVVVDDGSETASIDELLDEYAPTIQIAGLRIPHSGRSAAKNLAVLLARSPLVLFFDDDDRACSDYLERHLLAHLARRNESVAILGHTDWAPELEQTPLMHYVTDVDRLLFAYERLGNGQELDWRGFWEGRISAKRSFLMRHALHDQRINYSIDIEMGWRLAPHGLRVVYDAQARSVMARAIDFESFCARTEAKGRAHAIIAELHPDTEIAAQLGLAQARSLWERERKAGDGLLRRISELETEAEDDPSVVPDLQAAYRRVFRYLHAKGVASVTQEAPVESSHPTTLRPRSGTEPDLEYDGTPGGARAEPRISITIPVWSRTPELAEMAKWTIDRIWEVARVPTEVIVVDNGSPHRVHLPAKVYRNPENLGVSAGWNTGIRLSSAPVVVVLNSDCRVEPGWDEALHEAASSGRRIAFPYTDHCDGRGFVCPDQGGTAGWCFTLSRAVYEEIGPFDEWFSPAFGEDTDYWHRAWQLGIELTPVPAARVIHARRTTAGGDPRVDWLLQGHRYKYGWKHGVDPHRAPPYYNRDIVEFHGSFK